MKNKMISAEIITIGTELLLGDVVDINTPFIAKELNKLGIDVYRTITVGDNVRRISNQINQSLAAAHIVITTGGLGPTVDDPTRDAVAHTFGVDLIFSQDLWEQIKDRFRLFNRTPTKNNRKQAYLPLGAVAIENTVGTAPAFYITNQGHILICLPGVPSEVQHLFQTNVSLLLKKLYHTGLITLTKIIRTAGMGESSIDDRIAEFERMQNPTVGVTAHPGQVDIRITAKAADAAAAASMIAPVQSEIENILSDFVFGFDEDTLENIVSRLAEEENRKLILFHLPQIGPALEIMGLQEIFHKMIEVERIQFQEMISDGSLYNILTPHDLGLHLDWVSLESREFSMITICDGETESQNFSFGGHETLYQEWLKTSILNTIRIKLKNR
jgi:competence/damage-inducible protein CinA-like protein